MILHHHRRSKSKQDNDHKCIQTMQDDEKQRNNQFLTQQWDLLEKQGR